MFIGKNADEYLRSFEKFTVKGGDQFVLTWNSAAFLVPFFWTLYRKLYFCAFLAFLLTLSSLQIPGGFLIPMIIFGITGNYLYYIQVKKKTLKIRQKYPSSTQFIQRDLELARLGGVNHSAVLASIILILGLVVASIYVPNPVLTASKVKRTQIDMRAIGKALETYRNEYDRYPIQATEAELSPEILPRSYYAGPLQDGWGNEFRYMSEGGTSYTLVSYGKDKTKGKRRTHYDADIRFSGGNFIDFP